MSNNLKGLTFIVSDKCNITCDFCGPDCGPTAKGNLTTSSMLKIYKQQKETIGITNVVFTGGEPTLFLNEILPVIETIFNDGYATRVVTNAYWGKSESLARKVLGQLKSAGLTELNYSVDDFHQKYVPMEHIKTAMLVAEELKIPVLLAFKTQPGGVLKKEDFERLINRPIPYLEEIRGSEFDFAFSSGITVPLGRGEDTIDKKEWVRDIPRSRWSGPCSEVFKNITIQPNGFLSPCCGIIDRKMPEFYFKNLHEEDFLETIIDANSSTLYNWLASEGPEGIMEYILKLNPAAEFLGNYIQNCHLCQEIFSNAENKKFIKLGLEEKKDELLLKRLISEAENEVNCDD